MRSCPIGEKEDDHRINKELRAALYAMGYQAA